MERGDGLPSPAFVWFGVKMVNRDRLISAPSSACPLSQSLKLRYMIVLF